jgi:hypothetical protein
MSDPVNAPVDSSVDSDGSAAPSRKPYEAPALRAFGKVGDLTQLNTGTGADGGGGSYSQS